MMKKPAIGVVSIIVVIGVVSEERQ